MLGMGKLIPPRGGWAPASALGVTPLALPPRRLGKARPPPPPPHPRYLPLSPSVGAEESRQKMTRSWLEAVLTIRLRPAKSTLPILKPTSRAGCPEGQDISTEAASPGDVRRMPLTFPLCCILSKGRRGSACRQEGRKERKFQLSQGQRLMSRAHCSLSVPCLGDSLW